MKNSKADRMEMSVLRWRRELSPASTLCTATLKSSEVCLPRIIHNILNPIYKNNRD